MANQDDFEKLVSDMGNAETVNEAVNTMILGVSAMLANDIETAKKLYATDQQLQSLSDTQVNLEAHTSEFVTLFFDKIHSNWVKKTTDNDGRPITPDYPSVAERLAAGEPRSYAHAAVQGSRGAEVLPPTVVNPAELPIETTEEIPPETKDNG